MSSAPRSKPNEEAPDGQQQVEQPDAERGDRPAQRDHHEARRPTSPSRPPAPAPDGPGAAILRRRCSLTDRPLIPIIPLGITPGPSPRRGGGIPGDPTPFRRPRPQTGAAMTSTRDLVRDERDQFAFHDDIVYLAETKRGLTRDTVEEISRFKNEPDWMLQFRLRAYDHFLKRPMPSWGGALTRSTSTRSSTTASRPSARRSPGTTSRSRSRRRSRSWASPRRSASSWPASAPSTTPRSSTTRCARS